MINNYSYDINKATPYNDTSVVIDGSKKYNYNEIYGSGLSKRDKKDVNLGHRSQVADIFSITMGQNHHFKFEIPRLMVNNAVKHKQYGNFLPIKSLSYKPVAVESTKIAFGIFADFPIFHKRKMGAISVVLQDTNLNDYEEAVWTWFDPFDSDGYVAPMSEIVQTAKYIEYKNDGTISHTYSFDVIPDGEVSVSRQYEQAGIKEISFNLLIVSPIQCIKGYSLDVSGEIVNYRYNYNE